MMPIAKPFIKTCNVLIIDLPGFGLSDEPKEAWDLYTYADMVEYFVKELNMTNPILIGHSFGGKISICYALKYKAKKLILMGAPYEKKISKPTFKMKVFKLLKKTPFASFAKKTYGKY